MPSLRNQQKNAPRRKYENIPPEVLERHQRTTDLSFIGMISVAFFAVYLLNEGMIYAIYGNPAHSLMIRLAVAAVLQLGAVGLAPIISMLRRYETLGDHGIQREGMGRAIALSLLCFLPVAVARFIANGSLTYDPFHRLFLAQELLNAGFPNSEYGMLVLVLVWGLLQGLGYLVLTDKINARFPMGNFWLDMGALISGIWLVLTGSMSALSFFTPIECAASFLMMYCLMLVRKRTGNGLGVMAVFFFLWNMV